MPPEVGIGIVQIVLTAQPIPIAAGVAIHHASRTWTEKLLRVVPLLGQGGLAISGVLILAIGAKQCLGRGAVSLLGLLVATSNFPGTDAIPAVLVFAIFSMMLGLAYGRWMPEGSG